MEAAEGMSEHTHIVNGKFKSGKYPGCPAGKVPLSTKDKVAQPHLWQYAIDLLVINPQDQFALDIHEALVLEGYQPRDAGKGEG